MHSRNAEKSSRHERRAQDQSGFWWCYMHSEAPVSYARMIEEFPTDNDVREWRGLAAETRKSNEGSDCRGAEILWSEFHMSGSKLRDGSKARHAFLPITLNSLRRQFGPLINDSRPCLLEDKSVCPFFDPNSTQRRKSNKHGNKNRPEELTSGLRKCFWSRGLDLNQRPPGYEPGELPDCSTPHDQSLCAT